MNTNFLLAAASALMLLTSPAMALPFGHHDSSFNTQGDDQRNTGAKFDRLGPSTSRTTMEQCNMLESRFDDSIWRYKESPRLVHARELGDRGIRYCSSGNTLAGTADLRQALHILNKAAKA